MSRYVFLTLAILISPVPALAAAEQVGQDQPATREVGSPLRKHGPFYRDVTLLRTSPGYKKLVERQEKQKVKAQTEDEWTTLYLQPGHALHHHTEKAFQTVIVGDGSGDKGEEGLLSVRVGATDHEVIITANSPDGTLKGHTNVILLDDKGETVENLYVVVTPFNGPSSPVQVHQGSGRISSYQCTDYACASNIGKKKNGMNGADSLTTTEWSDGSSSTSRTYNRK